VGAGRGGNLEILYNDNGKFRKVTTGITAPDDISRIVAWRKAADAVELIVGLNHFETGGTNRLLILEARGTNVVQKETVVVGAAIGALAITEAGGAKILFAGGKFVPGRFPEPAPSHLFELKDGKWIEDTKSKALFAKLGAVTDAVWTDFNGDGAQDLAVACDWGAIRVFEWKAGTLSERSNDWGLNEMIGRWQSVATGDFDSDGKIDLVAGNWGLNSMYNQAPDGQAEIYFGDFNDAGRIEMMEAYRTSYGKVRPWRDMTVFQQSMPWIAQTFATHKDYAAATVSEILGTRKEKSSVVRTKTLASTMFLNKGAKFEAVPLPREAQFTPVFGIAVADFNADRFQDIALAQNFFATREGDGPMDAGRGLVLRGASGAKMSPMTGSESGVVAYGEQPGIAAMDFDKDGKVDLVIGQNGGETKLFRNQTAAPAR